MASIDFTSLSISQVLSCGVMLLGTCFMLMAQRMRNLLAGDMSSAPSQGELDDAYSDYHKRLSFYKKLVDISDMVKRWAALVLTINGFLIWYFGLPAPLIHLAFLILYFVVALAMVSSEDLYHWSIHVIIATLFTYEILQVGN